MSIEESLKSLRHLISSIAPVHEQLRAIDAIMSAYKGESDAFTQLKEKHSALGNEYEKFKSGATAEVAALKAENSKLKPKPGKRLDKLSEEFLIAIANGNGHIRPSHLMQHFGPTRAKCEYILDQLSNKDFVSCSGGDFDGLIYLATSEGRKYLADNNLL